MAEQEIIELLKKHKQLTWRQIKELSGLNFRSISRALRQLLKYREIKKTEIIEEKVYHHILTGKPFKKKIHLNYYQLNY